MVLEDVCNSSVYDKNAFFLLGLPVDTTSRKIRRRQEDLIDGLSVMGAAAWDGEFEKYLLGNICAPKVDFARGLFEQLKDPEFFATEMFFWFWPQGDGSDDAVSAILRGERDVAVRIWVSDMGKPGARGLIARHNLAIALHYYAIDGEKTLRRTAKKSAADAVSGNAINYSDVLDSCWDGVDGSGDETQVVNEGNDYLKAVDQYWRSSFELWEDLADDDSFWDIFGEKVEKLNDPRLDAEFIESFRELFPVCFDRINADFMVEYAQSDDMASAKRHFDYMVSTMSGEDDVEETMERAFKPMADKVKVLIKQCTGVKNPKQVLKACKELLNGSSGFVKILKTLVPNGNSYTKNTINDIVTAIDGKLPMYSRETGDYEPCLALTKQLLPLAASPMMKDKIEKSIAEWSDLVKEARARGTCVVCNRYIGKNIGTTSVKLHCDVHRDPLMYGRYEFRTRTIDVPVCSGCLWKFENNHAKHYGPVKKSLSEGWKFGEKPSQAELDSLF